jgi:polyphosphate kinase
LMEAAQRGKEVVVVVELKARFDEQSNIHWARRLEERGGTVVYGLVGLKTHCKLALVLRKEEGGFRRYAHIGTGNYNPETAKLYTDVSLLTSDVVTTQGISEVFNYLTANTRNPDFAGLWVSPRTFLSGTLELIHRERLNARKGLPAGITAKFNALLDTEVIEALYAASREGVEIRLMVRGICALRPEVPGMSDHIKVKSVIGRYLEHSRVYAFRNAGQPEVFIGSGDWMMRNLRERVEVVVPVQTLELRERLLHILSVYWHETAGTRWMHADGHYTRAAAHHGKKWGAQDWFSKDIHGQGDLPAIPLLWEPAAKAEKGAAEPAAQEARA